MDFSDEVKFVQLEGFTPQPSALQRKICMHTTDFIADSDLFDSKKLSIY